MSSSDIYTGPMIEPAPPFWPQIEPPSPDTRITFLLAGQPPNTMATGKPKEYPESKTADDPNGGDEYPQPIDIGEGMGAAISVADMAANAGSLADAAGDIAAAAAGAMAEKAASLIGEYSAKILALPASIPGKIAKYTGERFGKSKGDTDKFGAEYDPVKLSLGDVLNEISSNATDTYSAKDKEKDAKRLSDKTDAVTKDAQKFIAKTNKLIAKSNKVIGEITSHVLEGADWMQQNINKELARVELNITQELETAYKKVENDINTFCENEGNAIGARLVGEYNKILIKQAKKLYDDKKKLEKKAKIKTNALIHKAKLQIFAMLGL